MSGEEEFEWRNEERKPGHIKFGGLRWSLASCVTFFTGTQETGSRIKIFPSRINGYRKIDFPFESTMASGSLDGRDGEMTMLRHAKIKMSHRRVGRIIGSNR